MSAIRRTLSLVGRKMTKVMHRSLVSSPVEAVGGDGLHIFDKSGKKYLDASGGAAVSCLGHQHPRILDAIKQQADKIAYAHSAFFTTEPAEELAEFLTGIAPDTIQKVYLVSGGSEAMESAIKLARQYFCETDQPARTKIIARRQSYHGNTLGALAVGGNEWRRKQFTPLLIDVAKVSPCYEYRHRNSGEIEEEYGLRVANELEEKIVELGPDTVAAFVAETVVGATGGAIPPVSGYFKRIREICDKFGVLLILDEVMCGVGRTGSWFAFEQDGIVPDIVTIAKGLAAGYQPIGAVLLAQQIYDQIKVGTGFFQHGYTFMGHSIACAAGLETLKVISEDSLISNVIKQGDELRSCLGTCFDGHPHIGDIRGRGLFQALEFVSDRVSKDPFKPSRQFSAKLKKKAFESGLICYPMSGTIDGVNGDHVLLAPPYIAETQDIENMVNTLRKAVDETVNQR